MTSPTVGPALGPPRDTSPTTAEVVFLFSLPLVGALLVSVLIHFWLLPPAKQLEDKQETRQGLKNKRREVSPPRGPNHIAKLPAEILLIIFGLLQKEKKRTSLPTLYEGRDRSSLPTCARICKSWQPLVESITFRELTVKTGILTSMDHTRDILIWNALLKRCHLVKDLWIETQLCHFPAAYEGQRQRAPQPLGMQKLASNGFNPTRIGSKEHGAAAMSRFKVQHGFFGARMLGEKLVDACEGCDTIQTTWDQMEQVQSLSKGACRITLELHVQSRQLPNVRHPTMESYRANYRSVCPWCDGDKLGKLLKLPALPSVNALQVWYDIDSLYFDSGPSFHMASRMPNLETFSLRAYRLESLGRTMPLGGSEMEAFGKFVDMLPNTVRQIWLSYPAVPAATTRALGTFVHSVALRPGLKKLVWCGQAHNSIFGGGDNSELVDEMPESATLEDFTINTIDTSLLSANARRLVSPQLQPMMLSRPEELTRSLLKMANMAYRMPSLRHLLLVVEGEDSLRVQYIPGLVVVSEAVNRFPLPREVKVLFRDATHKQKGTNTKTFVSYPREEHHADIVKRLQRAAASHPRIWSQLARDIPQIENIGEESSDVRLALALEELKSAWPLT